MHVSAALLQLLMASMTVWHSEQHLNSFVIISVRT